MSGHSKWSTIKRKKGATDAKRGKLFTRLLKEIQVAAKTGGGSTDGNPRLKTAVAKAKSNSVPNDKIDYAIKRGTGDIEGVDYEEITYEGYGPGGIALLINTLTDNKNRTVAEVRHCLSRNNGSVASANSVSYLFKETGVFTLPKEVATEDELFELALEAGANDITNDGEYWQITTDVSSFADVREALEKFGEKLEGEIQQIPEILVPVDGDKVSSLMKLIDALDDLDDTQNVWGNFEINDEDLEKLEV